MHLRLHNPDHDHSAGAGAGSGAAGEAGFGGGGGHGRADDGRGDSQSRGSRQLNLLLTYGGWREHAFADQLPIILTRFGIRCYRAESGDEASDVIRREQVHIAVIDLSIPMHPTQSAPRSAAAVPAGPRVLQLLRRLEQPPPTIVVRPRQADPSESARTLAEALRDGAATVLDDPVGIETMLQALERVVRRHYKDHWPAA